MGTEKLDVRISFNMNFNEYKRVAAGRLSSVQLNYCNMNGP